MVTGKTIGNVTDIGIGGSQTIGQVVFVDTARIVNSKSPVHMLCGLTLTSLRQVALEVFGTSLNHAGDLFLFELISKGKLAFNSANPTCVRPCLPGKPGDPSHCIMPAVPCPS